MSLQPLPGWASWRHLDAREGHEVSYFSLTDGGTRAEGCTVALEAGEPWIVSYAIEVDARWRTRRAEIVSRSRSGRAEVRLESDGEGNWLVDAEPNEALAGCLDVDLEASALTNTFPVHRLLLDGSHPRPGGSADPLPTSAPTSAPAAFVRALDGSVERLEQTYHPLEDGPDGPRFGYAAAVFGVSCVLSYDRSGLVIDYPGLARRATGP